MGNARKEYDFTVNDMKQPTIDYLIKICSEGSSRWSGQRDGSVFRKLVDLEMIRIQRVKGATFALPTPKGRAFVASLRRAS